MLISNEHVSSHVSDEQRYKIKKASTALVTESKREILWLKGFGIFYVFGAYIIVQLVTDSFPIAVAASMATFVWVKRFVDTKPEDYIKHFVLSFIRPKHLTYRTENTDRFSFICKLRKTIAAP